MIGGGLLLDAANTLTTTTAPSYLKVSSVTIGITFAQIVTPAAGYNVTFGIPVPADAGPFHRYSLGTKITTNNYVFLHSLGGSIVELDTGVAASNGVRRSLVGRATTGAQSVWLDGTSRATGTVAGSITFGGSDVLAFGYPVVPLRYSGANIQIGVVWDRALLDEEIRLFDREPFCFLEPDIDGVWFASGASADVTVALSGLASTGAIGTLGPQSAVGVSGLAGTGAAGEFGVSSSSTVGLTGVEAVGSIGELSASRAGGARHYPKKRNRREALGELGNRDFMPKRNSRPGVAEEEMREVMAELRKPIARNVPVFDDEDDDEEAILWLI
jgi:hypothetical protein